MTVDVAVAEQHDRRAVRADVGHPAGQGTTAGHDDVADADAGFGALVERDDPPELGRLARDDVRGGRLELEAGAELQEIRQLGVLAGDLLQPDVLVREPLVLGAQRAIVHAQAVDLGDGRPDRGDPAGDIGQHALDRAEREAEPALQLADEWVRRDRHEHEAQGEQRRVDDAPAAEDPVGRECRHPIAIIGRRSSRREVLQRGGRE